MCAAMSHGVDPPLFPPARLHVTSPFPPPCPRMVRDVTQHLLPLPSRDSPAMSRAARAARSVRSSPGAAPAPPPERPLRLLIPAGGAAPGPPLGPVLGQRGIPIGAFCQDFNTRSKDVKPGVPLRVQLLVRPDRSYELTIGTPPTSYFLKAIAGVTKGASRPGHEEVGVVSLKHLYEVAVAKARDPAVAARATPLPTLLGALLGSARSLGLRVLPRVTPEDVAELQRQRRELEAAAEEEGGAGGGAKKK
ncbi:39S ribosomal protein L11, mitochondrial [Cuculus canorus]|uniref:39S ribosomal protein L11, mitochondrial n=1 Tax=Cuculus canorus TaxID=55661 RepID=UPI0023AA3C4E|nr:39S ribosomal protein L11, mitochondrial [Cuculus canorus]